VGNPTFISILGEFFFELIQYFFNGIQVFLETEWDVSGKVKGIAGIIEHSSQYLDF